MPKDLHELPKLRDGLSYLYAERCRVEQLDLSIELVDKEGRTPVPAAALGVLMLGPGTVITHAAVKALAENGCSILWCGEENVRFYAAGLGETRKAYRLLHQARCVCDEALHREVAWRMYELRFDYRLDDDVTLDSLRGMEGVRMRAECTSFRGLHRGVRVVRRPLDRAALQSPQLAPGRPHQQGPLGRQRLHVRHLPCRHRLGRVLPRPGVFSPHAWGWTDDRQTGIRPGAVFPTRVGMDRLRPAE